MRLHRSTAHAKTRYPENHPRDPPWGGKMPSQSPFHCVLARNHKWHHPVCQPMWSLPETPEENAKETLMQSCDVGRGKYWVPTYSATESVSITIWSLSQVPYHLEANWHQFSCHNKSYEKHFAEHGIPSQLITDNGLPYNWRYSFATLKKHMVNTISQAPLCIPRQTDLQSAWYRPSRIHYNEEGKDPYFAILS